MTMMPWEYQPTEDNKVWLIIDHHVSQRITKPRTQRGRGKSITEIIAERKASSPEAAESLINARKSLARAVEKHQGRSLKTIRLDKGLSQSELAELMETQQSYIAKIERNPTDLYASTINKLAKALDTTCDEIIEAIANNE